MIFAKYNPFFPALKEVEFFHTNTHKSGETYAQNTMKIMIITSYLLGLAGVFLQSIVTDVPDRITMGLIVVGLTSAIVLQWREANKARDNHRQDLKELISKNIQVMQELKDLIRALKN